MGRLDGAIAVVTGGTQGLGAEVARLFAERGAAGLVICGRNAAKGTAVADAIEADFRTPVAFVEVDLADVGACRSVIACARNRFGRVDVLANIAAITDRGTILDTDPDLFDRIMAVNVRAPFFLMQEAVKLMRETKVEGSIVNVSSVSSHAGQPFIAAYCASKGALDTLTRNTAYALLNNRIRVNALNIGWMASEGEKTIQQRYHGAGEDWLDRAGAHLPNGRLVDPKEVARAIAFLASAESGLMTGACVEFDQSVRGAFDSQPMPDAPL
ncbi:SDR family oxidoreductase [Fulvimarina endophytica]|uniref:SDR family oxidoreductase n=1 Tax=Fulvimarina endophytica TaxID=2293836 RepID=A0A371X9T4_9HYPH|nr:SDR family oxidoreductase [Fulvimarina endophytica]RFC65997.1 SDR family oxidoreductase [Fulvimarina endophytica]